MIDLQELLGKIKPYVLGWVHPPWKTWTPTIGGFSSAPTGVIARYVRHGSLCTLAVQMPNAGTSNATSFVITAPFPAAVIAGMEWGGLCRFPVDNGAVIANICPCWIVQGSNVINLYTSNAGGLWTASGDKRSHLWLQYEVAVMYGTSEPVDEPPPPDYFTSDVMYDTIYDKM